MSASIGAFLLSVRMILTFFTTFVFAKEKKKYEIVYHDCLLPGAGTSGCL